MIVFGILLIIGLVMGMVFLLDEPQSKPSKPHRFPEFEQKFFSTKRNR